MKKLLFKSIGRIDDIKEKRKGYDIYITLFSNEDLDNPKFLIVDSNEVKPDRLMLIDDWFNWYQYENDKGDITTEIVKIEPAYYNEEDQEKEYHRLLKEFPDGL
jgi:hypothetical protein